MEFLDVFKSFRWASFFFFLNYMFTSAYFSNPP